MAYTQNQIESTFQSTLGRTPTPYEVSTYQNASPQTLASLKTSYGKLNTSNSIVDYLKYTGVDPSTAGDLGKKYGIQGIGTAEGNTALLAALKSGKPPAPTVAPVVPGSVATPTAPPAPPVDPSTAPQAPSVQTAHSDPTAPTYSVPETQEQKAASLASSHSVQETYDSNGNSTGTAPSVGGSISGAAGNADPMSIFNQNVDDAYKAQQSAQQAVAKIDATLASTLNDKKAEIARSGGVVNESQLTSEVYAENAPLLAQRKELVTEYTQANHNYQKTVSDRNTAQANYNKEATLAQGQEKIDNQTSQFTQKLEQAGWKNTKVNVYDEYGSISGQQTVWTQNPADTTGYDSNGNAVTLGSGSQGTGVVPSTASSGGGTAGKNVAKTIGVDPSTSMATAIANVGINAVVSAIIKNEGGSPAGVQNNPGNIKFAGLPGQTDSGKKATDGGTFASYATKEAGQKAIADNIQKMVKSGDTIQSFMDRYAGQTSSSSSSSGGTSDMFTGSTVDATASSYSTANVSFNGKNTQLTQAYIDKISIAAIMNGGTIPSSAARGTKGLPVIQTNAIKARIGQLDPGGNLVANKALATGWGKALTTQIDYATKLSRSLESADADFKQILDKYRATGINQDDMPIANLLKNSTQYNLGSSDVASFRSSLAEVSRLYSQVFSSGGHTTDATNKTSQDILNGNMSFKQLTAVQAQLQALGKIDVDKANQSVSSAASSLSAVGGGGTPGINAITPKGSLDDRTFVENSLTAMGQSYDSLISGMNQQIASGGDYAGTVPALDNASGQPVFASKDEIASGEYTPL
jgi:hypothetical protein